MASNNGDLQLLLKIRADLGQAIKQLRETENAVKEVGRSGKTTGGNLDETARGADDAAKNLARTGKDAREAATGLERTARSGRDASAGIDKTSRSAKQGEDAIVALRREAVRWIGVMETIHVAHDFLEANIEMQRVNFTLQAATGSAKGAADEIRFLSGLADELGFNFRAAAQDYALLLASGKSVDAPLQEIRDLETAIARVSTVFHFSQEQVHSVGVAVQQIFDKNKAQTQELQIQLGQVIPGFMGNFERAMGMSATKLNAALQKGELTAQEVIPAVIQALNSAVTPTAVQEAAQATNAEINRLHNSVFRLENYFSQGAFITITGEVAQSLADVGDALATDSDKAKQSESDFAGLGTVIRYGLGGPLALIKLILSEMSDDLRNFEGQLIALAHLDFKSWKALGGLGLKRVQQDAKDYLAILEKIKHPGTSGAPNVGASVDRSAARAGAARGGHKTGQQTVQETHQIQNLIDKLKEQATAYGQSARAALEYRLQVKHATEAQKQEALTAFDQVAANKIKDQLDQSRQLYRQLEQISRLQREGMLTGGQAETSNVQAVVRGVAAIANSKMKLGEIANAADALQYKLNEIQLLYAEGFITKAEADASIAQIKRIDKATQKTQHQINQFAIQAARNMQDAFAQFLFDPFHEGLKGMLSSLVDTLHQMIAQIAAQKLLTAIFSWLGVKIPGYTTTQAGVHHSGGIAGAPSITREIPALAFLNAPRYHGGGIVGLRPNEVPAILEKGETVLPKGAKMVTNLSVQLNVTAPAGTEVKSASGRQQGNQQIVDLVLEQVAGDVSKMGKTGQAIQRRFGLKVNGNG